MTQALRTKEGAQHLHEERNVILQGRLVGASEAGQIDAENLVASCQSLQVESELDLRRAAEAMNQHQR